MYYVGLCSWGSLHHDVLPCIEVLLFLSQQRMLVSGSFSSSVCLCVHSLYLSVCSSGIEDGRKVDSQACLYFP